MGAKVFGARILFLLFRLLFHIVAPPTTVGQDQVGTLKTGETPPVDRMSSAEKLLKETPEGRHVREKTTAKATMRVAMKLDTLKVMAMMSMWVALAAAKSGIVGDSAKTVSTEKPTVITVQMVLTSYGYDQEGYDLEGYDSDGYNRRGSLRHA